MDQGHIHKYGLSLLNLNSKTNKYMNYFQQTRANSLNQGIQDSISYYAANFPSRTFGMSTIQIGGVVYDILLFHFGVFTTFICHMDISMWIGYQQGSTYQIAELATK